MSPLDTQNASSALHAPWRVALVVLYVMVLCALAITGSMTWRMYCEGFGCLGKGVAWFAWTLGFGVTLLLGWAARRAYRGALHAIVRYLVALQLLAGVALLIYWLQWQLA
jgi:hypothetical protein